MIIKLLNCKTVNCEPPYTRNVYQNSTSGILLNCQLVHISRCDLVLESKMAELNQIESNNNEVDQTLCENFTLSWKLITYNTTIYTYSTKWFV